MENNEIIELDNGKKYAVIMSLENDNKEYILTTETDEENIKEEVDIFIRDRENNIVKEIEDEFEYDLIKSVLERKLDAM